MADVVWRLRTRFWPTQRRVLPSEPVQVPVAELDPALPVRWCAVDGTLLATLPPDAVWVTVCYGGGGVVKLHTDDDAPLWAELPGPPLLTLLQLEREERACEARLRRTLATAERARERW